jgi:anti-sigma factor RsiW
MQEHRTELLSLYLDDDLAPAERQRLEAHLEACDECRTTLDELRAVVAAAALLPERQPPRDLWAGIRAGIEAPVVIALPQPQRPPARRFAFTAPQLAAAGIALVLLSSAAAWFAATRGGPAAGVPVAASAAAPEAVHTVAQLDARYVHVIDDLEAALADAGDVLDPATVAAVRASLETIDQAIAEAREALERDPANPFLGRHLDSTMRRKVDLLRRVTRVASMS